MLNKSIFSQQTYLILIQYESYYFFSPVILEIMTAKFYMNAHCGLTHGFVLTIIFYYMSLSPFTSSFTGSKILQCLPVKVQKNPKSKKKGSNSNQELKSSFLWEKGRYLWCHSNLWCDQEIMGHSFNTATMP